MTYETLITTLEPQLTIDPARWPDAHGRYHADCPYCTKETKRGQTHFTLSAEIGACYCQVCGQGGKLTDLADRLGVELAPAQRLNGSTQVAYDYHDEHGQLIYQAVRYYKADGKHFYQRKPDGRGGWVNKLDGVQRVLYRLPEVIEAVATGKTIYLVEGEKDVETLRMYGLVATTNVGGAGKWQPAYGDCLKGADVVILTDNDTVGQNHADDIERGLRGVARSVKRLLLPDLPPKGDVSDWLDSHTIVDLQMYVDHMQPPAPERQPLIKKLRDLMAREFAPTRYTVPGLLPEGAIILGGKPKMGKSALALGLGLSVAAGGMALGTIEVEQGAVLYLDLENGERRLQGRARDLLLGEDAPDLFDYADQWPDFDHGGLALIEAWCEENPQRKLIIVDTLKGVRPRALANQSVYDYDYQSVEGLHRLADRYHVTVLIVHHTRKAGADDFIEELSGSNGLSGAVDGVMVLRRARSEADGELHVTGRDVDEQKIALRYVYPQWQYLGDAEKYSQSKERLAIVATIRQANRPMTAIEVSRSLSKKHDTIRMLMYRMLGRELTTQSGGYYDLAPTDYLPPQEDDGTSRSFTSDHTDHTDHTDHERSQITVDTDADPVIGVIDCNSCDRCDRSCADDPLSAIPEDIRMTTRMMLVSTVERNQETARERCSRYGLDYEVTRRAVLEASRTGGHNV